MDVPGAAGVVGGLEGSDTGPYGTEDASEKPEATPPLVTLDRFDSSTGNPSGVGFLQKIRDLRDVHHLVKTLEEENARLKSVLQQMSGGDTRSNPEVTALLFSKTGYLNKYRPYATSSLFANTWEPRYVVLKDRSVMYYKKERDVYRNPPRGQLALEGTFVEIEGLKRRKYWTFRVVDPLGVDLIRLSTESHSEMTAWVEALRGCGCGMRRTESSSSLQDMTFQRQNSGYTSDQSDVAQYRPEQIQKQRTQQRLNRKLAKGLGTGYDGAVPVHTHPKFSLLSSERVRFSDQSGMLTLMFIILAATNFRLVLENMLKYGIRFNPFTFVKMMLNPKGNLPLLLCWPSLIIFAAFGLLIEQLGASLLKRELWRKMEEEKKDVVPSTSCQAARKRWTEWIVGSLNIFNTSMTLWLPFHVMTLTKSEPLPSFGLTMVTIVLWMKLVSFVHVNWSLRQLHRIDPSRRWPGESLSGSEPIAVETDDMVYPKNLTAPNFAYYLVAPTLCYQLSYPRSPRFRVRWLLRRVAMLSAGLGMMLFITEQYIEPTIDNSIKPLLDMDWLVVVERVLKLSLPTLYFWIAMFYTLFELWLNVLAEVTRFGDREFYKSWWNSSTLSEYWRLWNMPVHKWMLRHVYFPAINMGMNKFIAGIVVFFVSAVLHEVLVGVPLHMLRGWAFWGLMLQIPLIWLTEMLKRYFKSDRIGNAIFWISFCFLGQPIAEILYFHDYRKMNGH
jgi:diacylglycerol O-acyltransferase-1